MQLRQHVCCADTKILRIGQSQFEIHFFFYDNSWKDSKICKAKFLCKIEIKVQVSPIHRSTTVDILLFLFSGWVLKSSSLKVLYSLADVVRGEPLQRAWIISKLMTIWFWGHFSLFFSYHWYFNWSMYVRYPSFLYYLRSALTYVGYIRHHWFEIFQVLYCLFLCSLSNWLTWS